MKTRILFCLLVGLVLASNTNAATKSHPWRISANGDTMYIVGGTVGGAENAGSMETAINGDTTATGARINPNRVYALNEGQVYYQLAAMYVYDPTGTLTIVGVPSTYGATKPILLLQPTGTVDVGSNTVYGSIKMVNLHVQVMELDGYLNSEYFYCGTANNSPQSLRIDNCLFEFSNTDIFDCTNERGAIGGWPHGASFFITNSYFRNMFESSQWWSSRVFQCKHPIDTMWIENNTVTTGGLTFLQQNELTDFTYINHNTIINQKKYWILSPYKHNEFITNNIFVNQNWVGEDKNVTHSGDDPDTFFVSTIDIDTNNSTNGLIVQPKYMINGDTANIDQSQLGLSHLRIFVSNNINFYDPRLTTDYYNSSKYILADSGTAPNMGAFNAIPSYLGWIYPSPQKIENIPCEWMNYRTAALFKAYAPPNGGFVQQNTDTTDPQMRTPAIVSDAEVDAMAQWNQHCYGDPRFSNPIPALINTAYIYGDYSPTTLPGLVNGVKTDTIRANGTGVQVGIAKFTDLTENFSQSAHISSIDGLPIGSLMWNDGQNAAYNSAAAWAAVLEAYTAALTVVKTQPTTPKSFELSQNYPNPFNPSTVISYQLSVNSAVTLKVYDVLGREVKTLVSERQTAGIHSIAFKASNLTSGVYFYRLQAGSFTQTKKLMVIK